MESAQITLPHTALKKNKETNEEERDENFIF